MGPVASQEAIKLLGTNGGGFFNANSAHPFENPTPLSNFVQMLAIFLIPAALCFTFGRLVGDRRQGWAILAAMTVLFLVATAGVMVRRAAAAPALAALGVDQQASALQSGGNMEGKETRFGIAASALFAAVTTAASCGAVNAMHDSFTPLGGAVPLLLMQLGEVVFGGVGSGLYGMLVFAIMAVFIAGLMIGRTPEYLGKKIEAYEMKMTSIAILVTPLLVLAGTAIAVIAEAGKAGVANPGAHGFSEILYAFSSAANNNGSAFAGLSANTPFYNTMLAIAMWFGRFGVIVPVLAIAGSLAAKQRLPANARHHADPCADVRRPADRRGGAGRRAELRAGAGARADRRAPAAVRSIIQLWSPPCPNCPRRPHRCQPLLPPPIALTLFDTSLAGPALVDAFRKLGPRTQLRNPVMFVV